VTILQTGRVVEIRDVTPFIFFLDEVGENAGIPVERVSSRMRGKRDACLVHQIIRQRHDELVSDPTRQLYQLQHRGSYFHGIVIDRSPDFPQHPLLDSREQSLAHGHLSVDRQHVSLVDSLLHRSIHQLSFSLGDQMGHE
jgi:hypothetical protein